MSCRDKLKNINIAEKEESEDLNLLFGGRILFGVDSSCKSDNILQNNLTQFQWVVKNKIYPNFWGRNINGENCLTKEEISFLHSKACKIAAIYKDGNPKETAGQGIISAKNAVVRAYELNIPWGTAVFTEIKDDDSITPDFLKGFAEEMIIRGFVPGFKVNTDCGYGFSRMYGKCLQSSPEVFRQCLIWATAPALKEYDGITDSHVISPDDWKPCAPHGMTKNEISVWQYGRNCHPINDYCDKNTSFNLNLIRNYITVIKRMF
ncbi:MAG: glycoside hydrolase domain-containing protein [Acutalibacteraceae bacterium]